MNRNFRLGVFAVSMLLVFAAGVFLIGNKQMLFTSTYRLNAEFSQVAGLGNGASVRVGGMHEGTVRDIELPRRADGKIIVHMDIDRSTRELIRADSIAAIRSEGLVGDKYVEITFGSLDAAKIGDGATIGSEPPVEMADLMKKADLILETAEDTVGNLNAITGNLKSISAEIDAGHGTVGMLINDPSIYQHANAATIAFQENMEALKHNFLLRGFFRSRGYSDASELAKHEIPRLPQKLCAKKFCYNGKDLFDDPETAELKSERALDAAGKFLEGARFDLVVVAASTSMKGDSDQARLLTQARSMVVREYLVKHFKLEDTRIKTIGAGKSEDVQDGGRVEILIYSSAS